MKTCVFQQTDLIEFKREILLKILDFIDEFRNIFLHPELLLYEINFSDETNGTRTSVEDCEMDKEILLTFLSKLENIQIHIIIRVSI